MVSAERPVEFGPLFKAEFIERPNRFLVRCRAGGGEPVEAFLPNPGRLQELLLPGATLYLTREASPARKTSSTVLAVRRPSTGSGRRPAAGGLLRLISRA